MSLAAVLYAPTVFTENRLRLIHDPGDRGVYFARTEWAATGSVPYRGNFQEYPPLAAYLIALPRLWADSVEEYSAVFSTTMAVLAGLQIWLLFGFVRSLDLRPQALLLTVLPAALYFTFNRLDIMVTLPVVASLYLLHSRRPAWAFASLGAAVFVKMYPVLYLPLYLKYLHERTGRFYWPGLAVFAGIAALITGIVWYTAGWEGVKMPYLAQIGRGTNRESLSYLVKLALSLTGWVRFDPSMRPLLAVLQLALVGAPLLLLWRISLASTQRLAAYMVIVTLCFTLSTRFHSPQWVLWTSCLLPLTVMDRRVFWLAVLFDVCTYIQFPLAYNIDSKGWPLPATTAALIILKGALITLLWRRRREPNISF